MDFVGKRIWFFLVSALVLLPGVVFLLIAPGLKPGIDFTGGSTIMFDVTDPVTQDRLRDVMTDIGHSDSVIQKMDEKTFFIRTKELRDDEKDSVIEEIQRRASPAGVNLLAFDLVSPVVAAGDGTQCLLRRSRCRSRHLPVPVVGVPQRPQPVPLRPRGHRGPRS